MSGVLVLPRGCGLRRALQGGAAGCSRQHVAPQGPGRPAAAGFQRHHWRSGVDAAQPLLAAVGNGSSAATTDVISTGPSWCDSGEAGRSPLSSATSQRDSSQGVGIAAGSSASDASSCGSAVPSGDADALPGSSPVGPARDMSLEPFRSLVEGRRFHCTMCGKCCTGEGEIWVSHDEALRIARHLNLSLQRFLDTHTKQYSKYRGWRMLKTLEGTSSCIFLGPDNKCSIHAVRPSQCSTYPWWPELMVDREWEWEKANVCEGFDHAEAGPLDVEAAAIQLREANKMTQLRLLASTVRMTPQVADWADQVLVWDSDVEGEAGARGETWRPPGGPGRPERLKGGAKPKHKGKGRGNGAGKGQSKGGANGGGGCP